MRFIKSKCDFCRREDEQTVRVLDKICPVRIVGRYEACQFCAELAEKLLKEYLENVDNGIIKPVCYRCKQKFNEDNMKSIKSKEIKSFDCHNCGSWVEKSEITNKAYEDTASTSK